MGKTAHVSLPWTLFARIESVGEGKETWGEKSRTKITGRKKKIKMTVRVLSSCEANLFQRC